MKFQNWQRDSRISFQLIFSSTISFRCSVPCKLSLKCASFASLYPFHSVFYSHLTHPLLNDCFQWDGSFGIKFLMVLKGFNTYGHSSALLKLMFYILPYMAVKPFKINGIKNSSSFYRKLSHHNFKNIDSAKNCVKPRTIYIISNS